MSDREPGVIYLTRDFEHEGDATFDGDVFVLDDGWRIKPNGYRVTIRGKVTLIAPLLARKERGE